MTLGQAGAVLAERYQLVRLVGSAIDGEVWQGHDQRLARSVTVRLAAADPDAPVDDPGVQPLITRLSQVNDPGVAAVYDVGVDDGLRYAVGEWIHGRTLGQIFATGRQPWQRAGDWGQQIGTALDSLHTVGIVHGTLTAESIAIQDDRRAKIIDLGLVARAAEDDGESDGENDNGEDTVAYDALDDETGTGSQARTTALPHAEKTTALPVDRTTVLPPAKADAPPEAADDVYALGAVLWWAVSGLPLAYATTTSAGPDPSALREAGVPPEFTALLLRMLAADPQARPTAGAAAEQFAAVQAVPRPDDTMVGPQLIAPTQNIAPVTRTAAALPADYDDRPPPAPSESRRTWAIVAGVLAFAVVGVLVGLLLANHQTGNANVDPTGTQPFPTGTSTDGSVVLPSAPTTAPTDSTGTTAQTPTGAPTTNAATTAPPTTAPTTTDAPTTQAPPTQTEAPPPTTEPATAGAGLLPPP
jgi:eukaryotic-like serine/threonine-protein kinase